MTFKVFQLNRSLYLTRLKNVSNAPITDDHREETISKQTADHRVNRI